MLKKLSFIALCALFLSACNDGNKYANPIESVADSSPPILEIPIDLSLEATGFETSVEPGTATAIDLVDGVVTVTHDAPALFPVGTTVVTYSATDNAGNLATAMQNVTVTDTTAPTISPPADVSVEATAFTSPVVLGSVSATDLVDGSVTVSHDAPALFPVGTTVVTYSATDSAGNVATAMQTVTVTDTTAPTISVPADVSIEATALHSPVMLGTATATDLVDGSVTLTHDAPALFPVGTTVVTYSATDSAGNVATAMQTVTVTDTTSPTLTVPVDLTLTTPDGSPVSGVIGTASATDLVDGTVSVTNDAPALFSLGTTTVTYQAIDSAGNLATDTQLITVVYANPPASAAIPSLTLVATKGFQFDWTDVSDATFYRLLENPDGLSGFSQLGGDITSSTQTVTELVPLYQRLNAEYILQSCNPVGCTDSAPILISSNLLNSIGEISAHNAGSGDRFGTSIALSSDGSTLAIGAPREDSSTTGINSTSNNSALQSGAVYIFIKNELNWTQQAYIKASNTDAGDYFGIAIDLSSDGNTLAVGAYLEDSNTIGVNNNALDNSATDSGAAYVFSRSGTTWEQQAYLKASNTDANDYFGESISLSGDGATLAVGARRESSNATGINGNETDNSLSESGAVYLFKLDNGNWVQEAYLKASNTGLEDRFGTVSLSEDGNTLAVGAYRERSGASGVNGDQNSNTEKYSGAAYIFIHNGVAWTQQAYLKASSPDSYDYFGFHLTLSGDGNTLAVGAYNNDSSDTGIQANEVDNGALNSGAAYVFSRSGTVWTQQVFLKASNTNASDLFGWSLSLSYNGDLLAIGAQEEDSHAIAFNGNEADNSTSNAGAVYVFTRDAGSWTQTAYVKNTLNTTGRLGYSVSFSGDGNTLAIGAERQTGGGRTLLY